MTPSARPDDMERNIALYPWYKFGQNLLFWQSVWFLFFQEALSGQEAIILYALRELSTTLLEVPTGVLSDWLGRRKTLVLATLAALAGTLVLITGEVFWAFAAAQVLLGAAEALASGTDNALMYQSLVGKGREDEVEAQQLRAWRFTFTALALSAVTGGAMALWDIRLPFVATALVAIVLLPLVLWLREPPHAGSDTGPRRMTVRQQFGTLKAAFDTPVLRWLFGLSVCMYGFGHLPFVFGQPFILQALTGVGLAGEAPLVSGAVSSIMMVVSVGTSHLVPALRARLGTAGLLLMAFAMQIWLVGMLALSADMLVIAVLFLRMVPSSLAGPLVLARVQPLLHDDSRATYLSLQSLCGRLVFAVALYVAAFGATDAAAMSFAEIQSILTAFVAAGVLCLAALWAASRRVALT